MATKKTALSVVSLLLAAVMLTGCSVAIEQPGQQEEPVAEEAPAVTEIRAQDDFYGYVNLSKLQNMEIGWNANTSGSFDEAYKFVDKQLDELIEKVTAPGAKFAKDSYEDRIRTLYFQRLENEGVPASSEGIFTEVFDRINSVASVEDYVELMSWLYKDYGVSLLVSGYTDLNLFKPEYYGYNLGASNYYLDQGIKSLVENRQSAATMCDYIKSVIRESGVNSDEAERRAKDVVNLVLVIARGTDLEALEAFFPMEYMKTVSFDEIKGIFTNIDIEGYLKNSGAKVMPKDVLTMDMGQLEALNSVFIEENLQALKDYALATFIMAYGAYLPDSFVNVREHYFSEASYDREKDARDFVKGTLSNDIGYLYADTYMTDEIYEGVSKLCEDLRTAYYDLIRGTDMFSQSTKELLCKKLDNFRFMIGVPPMDKREEGANLSGSDIFENEINIRKHDFSENLNNIEQKYDPEQFGFPPQEINACYNYNNTITIPLGILNKPFYDPNASEMENLGGIGSVIGHEMSHGFDSNCINFDANGAYNPSWLPEADREAFNQKIEAANDYYAKFTILDVYHVDGKLTSGENFADLGGIQCVLSVAKTKAEKKELLESYANLWCTLTNDTIALYCLKADVHSPAVVRVNAVVSCFEDFYDIYGVSEGDGMYIPPEERVTRW